MKWKKLRVIIPLCHKQGLSLTSLERMDTTHTRHVFIYNRMILFLNYDKIMFMGNVFKFIRDVEIYLLYLS